MKMFFFVNDTLKNGVRIWDTFPTKEPMERASLRVMSISHTSGASRELGCFRKLDFDSMRSMRQRIFHFLLKKLILLPCSLAPLITPLPLSYSLHSLFPFVPLTLPPSFKIPLIPFSFRFLSLLPYSL